MICQMHVKHLFNRGDVERREKKHATYLKRQYTHVNEWLHLPRLWGGKQRTANGEANMADFNSDQGKYTKKQERNRTHSSLYCSNK